MNVRNLKRLHAPVLTNLKLIVFLFKTPGTIDKHESESLLSSGTAASKLIKTSTVFFSTITAAFTPIPATENQRFNWEQYTVLPYLLFKFIIITSGALLNLKFIRIASTLHATSAKVIILQDVTI